MSKFLTPLGEVDIQVIGHASILLRWNGNIIITDPYSEIADYSRLPKADLILITHDHYDHFDKRALKHILSDKTTIVSSLNVHEELIGSNGLRQGDVFDYKGIKIKAVYAYNIYNKKDNGQPYHAKGEGNGYILDFAGFRLYFAGDTELIPEMKELGEIDLAFLPKNLPYTMSDTMFIEAAKTIMPKSLYAYHYFELDEKTIKSRLPKGVNFYTE